ncbi:hypothetical protein BDW69DRAFT_176363 [Aspergillus filifer]
MSSVNLDILNTAIDQISEKTLREVFKSLCVQSPETRQEAASRLLVVGTQKRKREFSDGNSDSNQFSGSKSGPKDPKEAAQALQAAATSLAAAFGLGAGFTSQVARYAFCENCKKEYDVTMNSATSCVYHPERREPSDKLWVDNDFNGPEDSMSEWEEDFPHCFEFPCCGETLKSNPTGCETGWHVERPAVSSNKRVRV